MEGFMDLISVIIILAIVGVILWALNQYVPMAAPIKSIINIVAIIVVVLWLLQVFGIWHGFHNVSIN